MVHDDVASSTTQPARRDPVTTAGHPLFDLEFVAALTGSDSDDAAGVVDAYKRAIADAEIPFHPLVDPTTLPARVRVLLREGELERVLGWLTTSAAGERAWGDMWDPRGIGAQLIDPEVDPPLSAERRAQARSRAALDAFEGLDPDRPLPTDPSGPAWGRMREAMIRLARDWSAPQQVGAATSDPPSEWDARIATVIVVDHGESAERVIRTVLALASHAGERRAEVLLALHPGRSLKEALRIAAQSVTDGVVIVPSTGCDALERAIRSARGAVCCIVDADVMLRDGVLDALVESLESPEVAAAQPVIVAPDGAIIAAGCELLPGSAAWTPFLEGLAADDLAFAARRATAALAPGVVALRTSVLVAAVDGAPFDRGRPLATELSARMRSVGRFDVLLDRFAVLTGDPEARLVAASQGGVDVRPRDADGAWFEAGWRVRYIAPPARPTARVAPILVRSAGHPRGEAQRWAIKIGAAFSRSGDRWGDVPFAADLADALRAVGCDVVVDRHHPRHRRPSYLDDVVLALRGRHPIRPIPGRRNILWVISRPELIDLAEFDGFDVVAAASEPWARWAARESGRPVEVLLQAAAARFLPAAEELGTGPRALFVGGAREPIGRRVVVDAARAGVPLELWGPRWREVGFGDALAGDYLDNARLPEAYASAGVVLSDHFPEMAEHGFINNRVFEAVASGARVISDPVEGLDRLFGGTVRTYDSVDELRRLFVTRDSAFPSEAERRQIARAVSREHSFAARAQRLVELATGSGS